MCPISSAGSSQSRSDSDASCSAATQPSVGSQPLDLAVVEVEAAEFTRK